MSERKARGGTLVLGGGFAGSYVARLLGKRDATIVSPENFMLFTQLLLGRAVAHDVAGRRVQFETAAGGLAWVDYERLVVALGSISRTFPIPGLEEYGLGFKTLADAIHLRNHVLRRLEAAVAAPSTGHRRRELTFVFVGAGYAGVEALGELSDLVRDALRYYDDLREAPQRWVLVDLAPRILPEVTPRLADYAVTQLSRRSVEIRTETTLERLEPHAAFLSDGERILTSTLV